VSVLFSGLDVTPRSTLRLRENLIIAEEDRLAGKKCISIDDLEDMIKKVIKEVADGQRQSI